MGWRVALIATVMLLEGAGLAPSQAQGPSDLAALDKQVVQLYRAGKYAEAMELAKQSLMLAERQFGPDHTEICPPLNNLAALHNRMGRYAEAETLYKRSLAVREKALKPDHPDVGLSLNNLAGLYLAQGRYVEAEPLYKRSLAIRQKAHGPDHAKVGESLNNLAALYDAQGRYADAEPLHQQALAVREKALGPEHPDVATSLNNLGLLYKSQRRYAEAEPLYKRSLAIREKALGPEHPDVGLALNNLAALHRAQGRHVEAVPLYKRAIAIREKVLGPDHRSVSTSLNNLAEVYREQGRYAEAEPLYKRSLAIREKVLGPDHHEVGASHNNLALLYGALGRYAEAEQLHQRSLAITEKALGPDHPEVGRSLSNLAALHFQQRDWTRAADYWRRSTAVLVRRAQRGTADVGKALTGKRKDETEQSSDEFLGLIKAAYQLLKGSGADATLQREMFQAAQWAQGSDAAASLAQMAARGAKGDLALAALVRERQDLVEDWRKRDAVRNAAVAQAPDKRDRVGETGNVERIVAIDRRIAAIDTRLAAEFPDYAALARPTPLSVEEAQAQLGADEALVLFVDTPQWPPASEETFVWVVTKTDMRWVRSDLGARALDREVAALRCGLAYTAWYPEGAERCSKLLGVGARPREGEPLPFDHARAHKLYSDLFGKVQDLISGKHLLIVPSGALTQLPFQVLVTAPPRAQIAHRAVAWLARSHAVTVLPAVSSLKALRRVAKPSAATKPIIGFGNPLLDGPDKAHAQRARLAREHDRCPDARPQRVVALRGLRAGVVPIATRNGLADPANLKMQTPLPETADELCGVARDLKADAGEIRLGARATEREIKSLSEAGVLARYRIVHFATHGTLAGQLGGSSEPGLILTPPATATEHDDGYLSASEIAGLKLDADWVILSACNTASGGATGAEALSGIARAFFYAQARALLVSHWEVDSEATVKLIVSAVGAISREAKIGRAEALRSAMLALIDKGEPHEAHPAFWAPFVVVGEGAHAP